ncbi:hypothetical protein LPB136_12135 [Tenacibaculum todarodis]|uniref:Uncharacterized protein n=1 Tax=Tenacibaculum todarodis TaxID=1850252 RepID=A0A1L3JLS4_9FLAO|nr:hypothetical protein [Tenacibaculum todarodis]APG66071.1 hypothetical protein LPB136_12135 [Tenacibaculum todarodis]
MKKIILVLAFVFASSSLVNAENLETKEEVVTVKKDCFDFAIDFLIVYELLNGPTDDVTGAEVMNNGLGICWLIGGEI